MKNKYLSYISLFSSAGVGCYGLKIAGFQCIATNELLEKRINIQKLNNVCRFKSGYIQGDIKDINVKNAIHTEIEKWGLDVKNQDLDVIIATPPCQGMSVANHSKKDNEIDRNSLVVESVALIKNLSPKVFILENVPAFWKTGCTFKNKVISIGNMIEIELSKNYKIHNQVINFKDYGSNSSRSRSIVIGVHKDHIKLLDPKALFPNKQKEKSLQEVIGHKKILSWGEYDPEDFFHSFRTYPERMRSWISCLEEGGCAFDNKDDYKKPHQIKQGVLVINQSKNADKYTRQRFDKVAPCIHTRNDQLASQNTIHPNQDRVFSIRELMLMMTIPDTFKWSIHSLKKLNSLSYEEKRAISKKEELNIRQSIGEAVPTNIIKQIACKIKNLIQ